MEYTKDMIFNVKYDDKGDKLKRKPVSIINRFIGIILALIGILTIVDFVLITSFVKLLY